MAKTNTNPEVRFAGFTEDWEERRIGDVAKFNPKHEIPDVFNYVDLESVVGTEMNSYRKEYKKSAPSRAQRLAEKGDVFYQTVRPYQKNNLLFDREDKDFVFSTGYAQLRPIIESSFLFTLIQKDEFVRIVMNNCTGTSYPAINSTVLASIKQYFPKSKDEQKLIGNFFENLDNLIAEHQLKHSKLKTLKIAMIDKMFPRVGQLVPEIRFRGYEGIWVEKEFGSIFNYERPDNYIVFSDKYSDKYKTPVLTANKAFILGHTNETRTFNGTCIIFDDFTLDSKFVDFPFMVKSSALKILTIQNKNNDEIRFAFYNLVNKKFEIMGHARHYISVVQKTKVLTPSISEQVKISNYFKNLDELMNNYETQINKLQNIKKAFLSKMFI